MAEKKNVEVVEETPVVKATRKPYRVEFETNDPHEDPYVYVSVNGKSKLIQKGKTVMLPDSFIEVLENAKNEREYALRMARESEEEYLAKAAKFT